MSKLSYLTIILFIFISNAYSAIPTIESLFRNGNNPDITADQMTLTLKIRQLKDEDSFSDVQVGAASAEKADKVISENLMKPMYLKLIFANGSERKADLLMIQYLNENFEDSNAVRSVFIPSLRRKVKDDREYERAMFYGVLNLLVMNDGYPLMDGVKQLTPDFPENSQLVNTEKLGLMKNYRAYLAEVKNDKQKQNTIPSPLKPESPAERAKVNELMKASLYKRSEKIEMVKEDGIFCLQVNLQNITLWFDNENHRLTKMLIKKDDQQSILSAQNYILFDGVHELPKEIVLKDSKQRTFSVSLLKLVPSGSGVKRLAEKSNEMEAIVKRNVESLVTKGAKNTIAVEPLFLY